MAYEPATEDHPHSRALEVTDVRTLVHRGVIPVVVSIIGNGIYMQLT